MDEWQTCFRGDHGDYPDNARLQVATSFGERGNWAQHEDCELKAQFYIESSDTYHRVFIDLDSLTLYSLLLKDNKLLSSHEWSFSNTGWNSAGNFDSSPVQNSAPLTETFNDETGQETDFNAPTTSAATAFMLVKVRNFRAELGDNILARVTLAISGPDSFKQVIIISDMNKVLAARDFTMESTVRHDSSLWNQTI